MKRAIEEGFILDVLANYATYSTYWKLASQAAQDPDVDKAKAAARAGRGMRRRMSGWASWLLLVGTLAGCSSGIDASPEKLDGTPSSEF